MQWFVGFVSALLRNPIFLSAVAAAIAADPQAPQQVKDDFQVIVGLAPYFASKTPGTIQFAPDGGGPAVPIVHVTP